jgi:hypothetical protein
MSGLGLSSFFAVVLVVGPTVGAVLGGPIEDLKPGAWYAVPNSHLSAVLPNPVPPGWTGPSAIMSAWSGGTYDTKRDRLIVWGGGHADYGGNEIYTFDITTLTWSRVWGPSPNIPQPPATCAETYSDGNPVSRHTYGGLQYLPVQDKFWIYGGSLYCQGGGAGNDVWTFDFLTSQWAKKSSPQPYYAELEAVTAYDAMTGHVFFASPTFPLMEYNPISNTWTERGDAPIDYQMSAGAIDTKRRKFVAIGGGNVLAYTLAATGTLKRQRLSTTGATEIINGHPGLVYDPVSDSLVAWNGGPNVYTLNMDTLVWTKVTTTGTTIPTPAPAAGTYGRWQYIPSKNAFIGVNSIDENVWIYKLTQGPGTPSLPDTVPPAAPTGLRVQ